MYVGHRHTVFAIRSRDRVGKVGCDPGVRIGKGEDGGGKVRVGKGE